MQRIRVAVLAGLAALAVVVFLVAPDEGRGARVPLLLLCGVLALIWHLVVEGVRSAPSSAPTAIAPTAIAPTPAIDTPVPVTAPVEPTTTPVAATDPSPPDPVGTEHRAGYFEVGDGDVEDTTAQDGTAQDRAAQDATAQDATEQGDDLADLPDPPSNWSPVVVEVPLAFHLDEPDDAALPELATADLGELTDLVDVTDLTDLIDLTDLGSAAVTTPEPGAPLAPVGTDLTAPGTGDPWMAFAAAMFAPESR